MRISFNSEHMIWIAESAFSDKDTLKAAGFWWHQQPGGCRFQGCKACAAGVRMKWWTFKAESAARLVQYSTDEATKESLQPTIKSLNGSRAADAEINIPVPDGLAYLGFQKAGIAYAAERDGTLIADEMGLGKTIQALGLINLKGYKNILIIVPASLRLNWLREAQKWLTDKALTFALVDSNEVDVSTANIVIVNYDRVKNHVFDSLMARQWDLIVIDECHKVKNPEAQRTRRVLGYYDRKAKGSVPGLISKATNKLMLTGTPILNRTVELQPIAGAIAPKMFGNFFAFAKRYCSAFQTKYGWDFTGASNLDELQTRLRASIMVRRLKVDVLKELPPKTRSVILLSQNGLANDVKAEQLEFSEWEGNLDEAHADAELALASGDVEAYSAAVARLDSHIKIAFSEMSAARHRLAVAKVPAVIEHCDEVLEGGVDKLVIFAHHHDVISALTEHYGASAVVLTGENTPEDRQSAVDRFQSDPRVKVFIGSIQAAGVGITLTAASHVVFAELDWVPGNVTQAEDRCHRIGQHDNVTIQHLVVDGSLDAKLAHILVWKQYIIEQALDTQRALPTPATVNADPATLPMPASKYPKATAAQREACATGLQILAGMCDGAHKQDGEGFNRMDTRIGRQLAAKSMNRDLTDGECWLARRILPKYHGQIGEAVIAAVKGLTTDGSTL